MKNCGWIFAGLLPLLIAVVFESPAQGAPSSVNVRMTEAKLCLQADEILYKLDQYKSEIFKIRTRQPKTADRAVVSKLDRLDRNLKRQIAELRVSTAGSQAHKDAWKSIQERAVYDFEGYHCDLETIHSDPSELLEASSKTFIGKTPRQLLCEIRKSLTSGHINPVLRYEFALANATDALADFFDKYSESSNREVISLIGHGAHLPLPAGGAERQRCIKSQNAYLKCASLQKRLLSSGSAAEKGKLERVWGSALQSLVDAHAKLRESLLAEYVSRH